MSGRVDDERGVTEPVAPAVPDGGQLAEWTVEAMRDPELLAAAESGDPRSRRLVRDAVRAIRRAGAGTEVLP